MTGTLHLSTPTAEPAICQECDPPGSGKECRGGDCYSCGGTGRLPPTPDRIGKDAVREALAAIKVKATCAGEEAAVVMLEIEQIARRALSATPAQEGEQ